MTVALVAAQSEPAVDGVALLTVVQFGAGLVFAFLLCLV